MSNDKDSGMLSPCPFCQQPMVLSDAVMNRSGSCQTKGCFLATLKVGIPLDDAKQVARFNTRQTTQNGALPIAQEAILAVRRKAAGTFTEEFSGQRGEDYDKAVLDCYAAVTAALQETANGR